MDANNLCPAESPVSLPECFLLFGAVNFLALQTHHFSELRSSQASALKSALPLFPVLALYLWCARVGVLLGQ